MQLTWLRPIHEAEKKKKDFPIDQQVTCFFLGGSTILKEIFDFLYRKYWKIVIWEDNRSICS